MEEPCNYGSVSTVIGSNEVSAAALYVQLGHLIATMPDFEIEGRPSPSTLNWLGRAHALVSATGNFYDAARLTLEVDALQGNHISPAAPGKIPAILYRALAVAELKAPAAAQGAFIPAGNAFDAIVAVGKVLRSAAANLLIVDPYMDDRALGEFAALALEGVPIRLLTDPAYVKPSLGPAVTRWIAQYGAERPLEARLTPPKSLHDRLISVDGAVAWTLTQSLKDFAARSPASIVRVDAETAALKIAAYEAMWSGAVPL